MSKVQMLRSLVKQRLTAAAEEIFGLFERTIAEYEEELCRSKEENERQRKLLDAVFNPQLRLHRADVQQLLVVKEKVPPEQQEWSSSVDQEDPESPHIKEKQEFTSTPGESSEPETETREPQSALNSLNDCKVPVSDLTCSNDERPFSCSECGKKFSRKNTLVVHMRIHTGEKPFSCSECGKKFPRKDSLDIHMRIHTGEKPFSCHVCDQRFTYPHQLRNHQCVGRQSSQPRQSQTEENREAEPPASSSAGQMETEADGEDCGGPEPARNSDPDPHLQPETHDKTGESSEPETDDSEDEWTETREPQSALNSLNDCKVPVSDLTCSIDERPFSCSECGKRFGCMAQVKRHMRTHTRGKPFSCSDCGKRFPSKVDLKRHVMTHTGEKPFSCSVCRKSFSQNATLQNHRRIHTGEKPFSCSECGKKFPRKDTLADHMRIHTGEKPFSCSECGKKFFLKKNLAHHMRIHTGEKPFSCSECGKKFPRKGYLAQHMRIHTGEKPFSCSVCDQRFTWHFQLRNHQCVGYQSSQPQNREAEPPASSSAGQMETEPDAEDCGGAEPARSSDPDSHLQPETHDKTGESSEPETDDSEDEWTETREPQSALNSLNDCKVPVSDLTCSIDERPFSCSECGKRFVCMTQVKRHMRTHTRGKPFSCSDCGKRFPSNADLKRHVMTHTGEKPFSCSECGKKFPHKGYLAHHMRLHTGEKPFSCSVCDQRFTWPHQLRNHQCVGYQSSQPQNREAEPPASSSAEQM